MQNENKTIFSSYQKQLFDLGWILIPNIIDAKLGLSLRKMLEPCKPIAWESGYKFPQRTYLNKLSEIPLRPFLELQDLNLANQIMGGKGWRFSPWQNTSCLVPTPPNMLYWCREHRDFLDDSKPYHPLNLWLKEFNNPYCFWRANLNLSPEDDDYLWIESKSHKWVNLIEEKARALRPRFFPEDQNSGMNEIIRQFLQEMESKPKLEQIIVPPFSMIIMRSTMLHLGGLYRFNGCKFANKITGFGRMALHFAIENDVHINVRQKIAEKTTDYAQVGIKWTEISDVELEKLSIL